MALTKQESSLLVELLKKAEWPLPKEVFHALVGMTISVPVELCILDEQDRILLFERKDHEFDALLGLGTVLRDSDNDLQDAIDRLLKSEVQGYDITHPENIGWVHVPKGNKPGQSPTRHEISLVFLSRLLEDGRREGDGVLYPLDALPDRLFGPHVVMLKKLSLYLQDGKPLAG